MKDLTWIDNLKFRVSYGEVGNDAGADYYAYKELFYSDVNAGIGAFYKIQIPNKNLKWETSGSLDIALEGRLFNRFNFSWISLTKPLKIYFSLFTIHFLRVQQIGMQLLMKRQPVCRNILQT